MVFTIKLLNSQLVGTYEAIEPHTFQSMRMNRNKAKFLKRIIDKEQEYTLDKFEIYKKYVEVDENGTKQDEEGKLIFLEGKRSQELNQELYELSETICCIDSGEYTIQFEELFEELINSDNSGHLTSSQAILLDSILTQYEEQKRQEYEEK